ncbi:MAG: hypothetical protein CUN55_12925, partial [Phototrophicales bacterium]
LKTLIMRIDQNQAHSIKQIAQQLTIIDYTIGMWTLIGIISLAWAARPNEAITELRVLFIEPLLFYIILRSTTKHRETVICLTNTLIAAGVVVALISLFQFVQGQSIITAEDGVRRLAGIYGSPNNLGLFLGRIIPIALAQFLILPGRTNRISSGFALGIIGATAILSQSAGAIFLGIPSAILTVAVLTYRRKAWPVVIVGLSGLIAIFSLAQQSARFSKLLDFSTGTNFIRLRVWQSTINILKDHPITGLGLDQFLYAFRGKYISPDAWQEPNLSHPHNIILDFWVRLGLSGVFLLVIIQIAFWKSALKAYYMFQNQDKKLYAIVIGVMGTMVNLLAHGLVDNSVFVIDLAYVFVFILGITVSLSELNLGAVRSEENI